MHLLHLTGSRDLIKCKQMHVAPPGQVPAAASVVITTPTTIHLA
jgi:hypothetical protein